MDIGRIQKAIRDDGEYLFNTADEGQLWGMQTITEVWPWPPSHGQLHVYISLPANMGSSSLGDATGGYIMHLFVPAQTI